MRDHLNNVIEWSRDNLMNVNYEKTKEILHFYTTVIRPVLEYACPV